MTKAKQPAVCRVCRTRAAHPKCNGECLTCTKGAWRRPRGDMNVSLATQGRIDELASLAAKELPLFPERRPLEPLPRTANRDRGLTQ